MGHIGSFFDMGGYAAFVWPSFVLTAGVMFGFLYTSLRDLRARERRLRTLEAQRPQRRRARSGPAGKTDEAG
ncbi:MAG: heme exporter protein CcmD [Kiloniellales bacterium]|nr:heme exporter protein CcmD [Kiloniellales bacterium]